MRNPSITPWLVFTVALAACNDDESSSQPRQAGIVTQANASEVLLEGAIAEGAVGDFFLRNDRITAIIQRPGRVFGLGPYGGNIIDISANSSRLDVLGETIPFINFGMTIDFGAVRVVNDGSNGEAAVIQASGPVAIWDFLNVQSFLPGILSYDPSGATLLPYDPIKPLPILVTATYTLSPGADHVEVRYMLHNHGDESLDLQLGFGQDMRGQVEAFATGRGYSDPGLDLNNVEELLTGTLDSPFLAFQADGYALGVVSRDYLDGEREPRLSVAVVGMALTLLGASNLFDVLSLDNPFELDAGQTRGYGFDLVVTRDVGAVKAWTEEPLSDAPWGTLAGVVRDEAGTALEDARVAAIDPDNGDVITAFVTDTDGRYRGKLPQGLYHVAADHLTRPADAGRLITVASGKSEALDIELGRAATVHFEVMQANDPNDATLASGPCRVALLGAAPERTGGVCGVDVACTTNSPFRHDKRWELSAPEPYVAFYLGCDTRADVDEALEVVPGRYLAVVSRGPEFDFIQQLIDVGPGESATVRGELHRVIDAPRWAASEFHVHQIRSPDSVVPLETRARSFGAAAIDFVATTDHDYVTDMRPVVAALGLDSIVTTVPGVETSTIDLGHFNSFPVEPKPGVQGGGPPDWAGKRNRPSPAQLFDRIREDHGARVVQVNHARMQAAYLTRLNPAYTFGPGGGEVEVRVGDTLTPELMLMAPGSPLFASNFDAMEIYNNLDDHEIVIRDWFNFLSMGFTPTGTAVSDTHAAFTHSPGVPRTYVAVESLPVDPDDLIDNLLAGRAIGSSGPVLDVVVRGDDEGTVGDVVSASGAVSIDLTVQTPAWYSVSTAEVFITQTYRDPSADVEELSNNGQSLEPVPEVTATFDPVEITRANGGKANIHELTIELDESLLDTIHASSDGWLVIRVSGTQPLYPVVLRSGGATIDPQGDTPETFARVTGGKPPLAFTNPIFLDRDGNGRYDAPFPMLPQ